MSLMEIKPEETYGERFCLRPENISAIVDQGTCRAIYVTGDDNPLETNDSYEDLIELWERCLDECGGRLGIETMKDFEPPA